MTTKERPILFSAAMVRALLDGRKTQTRRIVSADVAEALDFLGGHADDEPATGEDVRIHWGQADDDDGKIGKAQWLASCAECPEEGVIEIGAGYGQPGDRLWVRESHMSLDNRDGGRIITYKAGGPDFVFRAGAGDDDWRGHSKWTPSIHMRREYSRILLEITNVRVERVQEISETDAIAEGTTPSLVGDALDHLKYRAGFQTLWESINAARGFGWDVNPWVWVVEFKRNRP